MKESERIDAPIAAAQEIHSSGEANWAMPAKPANSSQTAQVHVLAHSPTPRTVRVCYLKGPEGSSVAAWATTNGASGVGTNIYLGGCVDIGGSDIELSNPNAVPVSGTYLLLPIDKPSEGAALSA